MGNKIIITDLYGEDRIIISHDDLVKLYEEFLFDDRIYYNPVLMDEYEALFKCIEHTFQLKYAANAEEFPPVIDPLFGDLTGKVGPVKITRETRRNRMSRRLRYWE